ncbi:unnamed protein product (macronuclear) [Paramecium tetraurelia]|uniref:Cyclic nucleotide-binding domain-containing protein n=1 Tax=Paramecium tetraurelia TaxID=5888 RepID=A0BD52_PARTE|nr:uncharacterized protein GSPATT00004563001 [Paramecium tetraurelia]CAK56469.1 unnamed protein product [Paramecium tetraurelia]|eukprot:XP_001423867.1 hypothetical protein (macronuclear) [Paramecium tetraurelia strain d4-2]
MNQTNITDNSHISHCQLMIQEESLPGCNNSNLYHSIDIQNQTAQQIQYQECQRIEDIPGQKENLIQSEVKKKQFSQLMVQFNIHHFKRKMLSYIHPYKELSKGQFSMISDKSSSFKSYPKKQQQKTSLLQYNKAVLGFRNIIKDFNNTLVAQTKKKVSQLIGIIPIINPYSTTKLFWDGIITIMRIYLLIWIPILIAFKNGTLEDLNAYTLNVCSSAFLIDLAMQTFTIRFDKGFPVKDRYQLIQYQINWWTAIELFSFIISLYFSIQFHQNNFSMSVVEDKGWTKTLLLLLIVQTKNILQFIENLQCVIKPSKSTNSLIELVKLICLILLIQHIFSCIWVIIGTYEHLKSQTSWLDLVHLDIDQPWHNIYLEAMYFISVTTFTVGYGDITPQNTSEKCFTIVYMFFCTLQLSYSVNTIGSILIQLKENNEEIKQKMTAVTEHMTNRQMSRGLQFKVREYLTYYWQQENVQKKNETAEIIRLLPEELQKSIQREGSSNLINKCSFFKEKFTPGFLNQLVEIAYVQNFQPGIIINDLQNIYIIEYGFVEILQNQTVVGQLSQFQQFGLKKVSMDLINETKYRTKSFTNLLIIPYASLVQLVAQNQNELEIVSQASFSVKNECVICKGSHVTELCPQVHFIPDKEKVIKKYLYNSIQTRGRIKRKPKDQFQEWKNELKFFQDTAEQFQQDSSNEIELLFPNNEKQQQMNACTQNSLLEINDEKPKSIIINLPIGQRGDLDMKIDNKDPLKSDRKSELKNDISELCLNQQFEAISQKFKQIQIYNEKIQKDIFLLYKQLECLLGQNGYEIDKYKSYKHYYKSWNIERIIVEHNFASNYINHRRSEKVGLEQISKYLLFPKMYLQKYRTEKPPEVQQQQQPQVNKSIRTSKKKKRIAIHPDF